MSDIRRIIEIFLDTENSKAKTALNYDLRSDMVFYRGTQTLIRCHLRLADGTTYYQPEAGSVWYFRIDSSFVADHEDLVVTNDAEFNIADDWTELDVTGGKITWRVDSTSTQLKTDIGDLQKKTMYAELWMESPSASVTLLTQWSITMRNIVSELETTSDLVYSSSNLIRTDGDDTVIYFPDGSVARRYEG